MKHEMIKKGKSLHCPVCGRVITFQNGRMEIVTKGDSAAQHVYGAVIDTVVGDMKDGAIGG